MDNLNTHKLSTLCEAVEPAEIVMSPFVSWCFLCFGGVRLDHPDTDGRQGREQRCQGEKRST
ncbi:MAG: hypothetical protein OXH76_06790 [Boseongicola sp.]|nr:hypothetical protein [Boseongicola sp.]MYH56538.1 hypothetical protein [Boseongicola sp. SB0675_bin_26]